MTWCKDVAIFAGTLTVAYLMLKVYHCIRKENDENSSKSQECEEGIKEGESSEVASEARGLKSRAKKRKLQETEGSMKLPKLRPNFFLGFQVNDAGIHKKIKTFQENIISRNPSLYPALIKISTLHVTLAVTHLATEVDIKTVKDKLEEWTDKNLKSYSEKPIILNFTGIGIFNNTVIYVDMEKCENYERLCDLSQSVNHLLSSAGFSTDIKSKIPHLTILKLSKNTKLLRSKKHFKEDFDFIRQHKENFGSQELSSVQLLKMTGPKDEAGYYKCFHQINLTDVKEEMNHSECCSPIPKPEKVD